MSHFMLTDSLFILSHAEICDNSLFILASRASIYFPLENRLVSSANNIGNVCLQTKHRSLI